MKYEREKLLIRDLFTVEEKKHYFFLCTSYIFFHFIPIYPTTIENIHEISTTTKKPTKLQKEYSYVFPI